MCCFVKEIFLKALISLITGAVITNSACAQEGMTLMPAKERNQSTEWTTLRANNNRDGRVVSTGEFKNKATLSQAIDFSTSESYVELFPGNTNSYVSYAADEMSEPGKRQSLAGDWKIENDAYLDLYGDGKFTKVATHQNVKYAKLFRADNKYYRIAAEDGYAFGNTDTTYVGFRVYEGNTGKLVLDKRFKKGVYMQRPHITVADMNNDGEQDIVITSWEGIYVFNNKGDSIAGLSQETPGWHKLRKRGFACLQDIDGDGYKDVVIIGSYPYHIDVIKNDRGTLKFGWTEIFDGHIESAKKISKPILNSVCDFDGDGSYEILVNVYNYNDENNWSGVLFDPVNGKVKAQIRNSYVLSASDLNNNGRYVFFCTETKGQSIPVYAALKAVSWSRGKLTEHLRVDRGEWMHPRIGNTSPTVTTHSDGVSNLAEDPVLSVDYESRGQKAFFIKIKNPDGTSTIKGYYISKTGKIEQARLGIDIPLGMYGEIIRERSNTNGTHSLLLKVTAFKAPAGIVKVRNATVNDLGRYRSKSGKTYLPVVADIDSDGRAEILISNDVGEMFCFAEGDNGKMDVRWKVPGHGMTYQYRRLMDYGVSVDDLDHDGFKEVIVSGGNESGAVLFVYDHNGKLLWQRLFPEINAGEITIFDGNIAFYGTAQSSKRKHKDVIVTVQRVIQHTGQTYCLNGTDGTVVWKLDTLMADRGPGNGTVVSGAGGNIFSTYDIDDDGSDEVMCGFGNIVFIADSNDGEVQFKSFMRKLYLDSFDYLAKGYSTFWLAEMLPVAFSDHGSVALSSFNAIAAGTLSTNGTLSWSSPDLDYDDRYWQCMANLDGDGKLWVVELSVRKSDMKRVLFAYDPVNGSAHKTFSMEISGTMPVACDMNADGKDEIVVSNSTGVYCIGYENGRPSILWNYIAAGCGPAVVADTDADGFVEVILATEDGKILIIDN